MELMNVYTGSQQTYCPRYQVLCLYQHTVSSSYGIGTSFHRIVSRWISIQGVEPRYWSYKFREQGRDGTSEQQKTVATKSQLNWL